MKIFLYGLLFFCSTMIAKPISYNYLCGNDENGCTNPLNCICVSADPSDQSRCLDIQSGDPQCVKPSEKNICATNETDEQTQANCLAMVWQSVKTPPCKKFEAPYTTIPRDQCAAGCTSLNDCK